MHFLLIALAVVSLVACKPEVQHVEATETVLRLDAEPQVLNALENLRVRTARQQGAGWVLRNDKRFAASDLRWPVEIVIAPPSESEADKRIEIVVDALGATDQVLVQARAITGFVRREQRVLSLRLAACDGHPLGFVCEPAATCLGAECLSCVEGSCAPTPVSEPSSLPQLAASGLDAGLDGAPDASGEGGADATGSDADVDVDVDAQRPDLDATDGDAGLDAAPDAEQHLSCEPGSEIDDAGTVCLDVDECKRGLDDCDSDPAACVNSASGLGFTCSCPAGYRGDGHGPSGCADIDECMEHTDSCGALAECKNTPGSYACGDCMPGFSAAAGGACMDIDECGTNHGGCASLATCNNQTGAANTCSCPLGYSGNGVGANGCLDVNECGTNNGGCAAVATCNNQTGAANTCSCPQGYSGNGVGVNGCLDVNECGTNHGGCAAVATCNNQTGAANTCSCPQGYSGNGVGANGCVDIVDCTASACMNGGTCVEGVNGFTCNCTSAFTGARCELEYCGDTTIKSRADLDAAASCKEIRGKLTLLGGATDITASDFPHLTKVTGDLVLTTFGAQAPFIETVNFGALQVVEGSIQIAANAKIRVVSFPALTTVGKVGATPNFQVQQATIGRLDAPLLTTIYGNVTFAQVSSLCSANFRHVTSVSGTATLSDLLNLPYSAVSRLHTSAAGGGTVSNIGCCTILDINSCDTSGNASWTCDPITCP